MDANRQAQSLPQSKRSRVVQKKSFAEVLKDKIMSDLMDKDSAGGFIQRSRWLDIKKELYDNFVPFLDEHKCRAPRITEAGCYHGQIKAMTCGDIESANVSKRLQLYLIKRRASLRCCNIVIDICQTCTRNS